MTCTTGHFQAMGNLRQMAHALSTLLLSWSWFSTQLTFFLAGVFLQLQLEEQPPQ